MVCLDVANGYSVFQMSSLFLSLKIYRSFFVAAVKRVRAAHPDKIIVAGNVVTGLIFDPGFLGA